MRIYYFDNLPGDQRLSHDYVPSRPVPPEKLVALGISYWHIPVEGHEEKIEALRKERDYKNMDSINVSKAGLGELYEQKMRVFYEEHMHEDEEIRYVLEGSGYFDVRESTTEAWIRLAIVPGDLIVFPAGIYHRFTLDEKDRIKVLRLFKDEPKWVPYARSPDTEVNPYRLLYLNTIGVGPSEITA